MVVKFNPDAQCFDCVIVKTWRLRHRNHFYRHGLMWTPAYTSKFQGVINSFRTMGKSDHFRQCWLLGELLLYLWKHGCTYRHGQEGRTRQRIALASAALFSKIHGNISCALLCQTTSLVPRCCSQELCIFICQINWSHPDALIAATFDYRIYTIVSRLNCKSKPSHCTSARKKIFKAYFMLHTWELQDISSERPAFSTRLMPSGVFWLCMHVEHQMPRRYRN